MLAREYRQPNCFHPRDNPKPAQGRKRPKAPSFFNTGRLYTGSATGSPLQQAYDLVRPRPDRQLGRELDAKGRRRFVA
jgi:hypothetical protein